MKNWNDFLSEFVLRAMTNREFFEEYSAQHITEFARQAWDAIQAAELPESEKAKEAPAPAPIPSNSTELKALARTARDLFSDEVDWIAIDSTGQVWAYDVKPTVFEPGRWWDNIDNNGSSWEIGAVAPPEDFTKELYEISKILSDDL